MSNNHARGMDFSIQTNCTAESKSRIPYLDIEIDDRQPYDGARVLLKALRKEWSSDDIQFTVFTDGYTNKLIACMLKDDDETKKDVVLIRIYGPGTDVMIDRVQERLSMVVFHHIGCAAPLYCQFRNGIAYGYSPGVVMNHDLVYQPAVRNLIAKAMAEMHVVDPGDVLSCTGDGVKFSREPCLFRLLNKWLDLVPTFDESTQTKFIKVFKGKAAIKNEINVLQKELETLGSPVVLCHNDLLFKNIIYDKERNRVRFIDFEYVAFNYQAFDIADHFCEFAGMDDVDFSRYPSREYQMEWLRAYLEFYNNKLGLEDKNVSSYDLEVLYIQVNKFALASQIMWTLWALIQVKNSHIDYDYFEFATLKMSEYYAKKDACLSLKLPSTSSKIES